MGIEAEIAEAIEKRFARLAAVASNPDVHRWPDAFYAREAQVRGERGVTLNALATGLGCSAGVLKRLVPPPIGLAWVNSRGVDTYNASLLEQLSAHPSVVQSRAKRAKSISDRERIELFEDHLRTIAGWSLDQVSVASFRSIEEQSLSTSDLTILIGRNGAGKTSFLDAISSTLDSHPTLSTKNAELPPARVAQFCVAARERNPETARALAIATCLGIPVSIRSVWVDVMTAVVDRVFLVGHPMAWNLALHPTVEVPNLSQLSSTSHRSTLVRRAIEAAYQSRDNPIAILQPRQGRRSHMQN